jgi:hypothetical protein
MLYKDIVNSGKSERLKYRFLVYKASDQKKRVNVHSNDPVNSFVFGSKMIMSVNRDFSAEKDFFSSELSLWIQCPLGIS